MSSASPNSKHCLQRRKNNNNAPKKRFSDYLEAHRAEVTGMITKQYTEEEIHQMFYKNGHDAGFDEGRNAGFDEGILSVLSSLVSDGTLTLKDAATRAGLSEDVFSEKMKNG